METPETSHPPGGELVTSVHIWQRMGQKLLSDKEAWQEERRSPCGDTVNPFFISLLLKVASLFSAD